MKAVMKICLATGLLLAMSAYALAAGTGETSSKPAPSWVLNHPAPSGGNTYFVASGNDSGGSESKARDAATQDLINQINQYLGVSISSESSAQEVASDKDYQASIIGVVTQKSTGVISGFSIAQSYTQKEKQGISVYLLGQYRTADLEAEKAKRAALIKEKEDTVSVPETKGNTAESSGALFDALKFYLQAANSALGSDIRNSDVKLERNLQNALRVVSKLQLTKVSGPTQATARKPFDQDFVVSVSDGMAGISGAEITASYKEYDAQGKARIRNVSLKSDPKGNVTLRLPNPNSVGAEKLNFALDISSYVNAFDDLDGKSRDLVDNLLDAVADKRVSFDYTIASNAKNITLGLIVADLSGPEKAVGGDTTAKGIQQRLSAAGFKLASLPIGSNFVVGKDDPSILLMLKDIGKAGKAERIAYGTSIVQNVDDQGKDGVFVTISATVNVVESATSNILLTTTKLVTARGSDLRSAMAAGFTKVGQDLGDQLARDLP